MALDATGTPTSPDSIPKYNTAVDPPSGKGFNAAMDAIQVALNTKGAAPSAPSGVKVWNNTTKTWNNPGGTADGTKFLRDDGTWAVAATTVSYARIAHRLASGTDGGAPGALSTWDKRPINTEDLDPDGILSLVSSQIVLTAGTYDCNGAFSLWGGATGNRWATRLRNVTDNATVLNGTTVYTEASYSLAQIRGRFTIAAGKTLEVQHWTPNAVSANAYGVNTSSGEQEVYAIMEFWKVA